MAIIKCPECGHQINENEKICPVCGVEIAGHVVKCHVCGEVYFNDEALCPNCHSTQYTILGKEDIEEDTPVSKAESGQQEKAISEKEPVIEEQTSTTDTIIPIPIGSDKEHQTEENPKKDAEKKEKEEEKPVDLQQEKESIPSAVEATDSEREADTIIYEDSLPEDQDTDNEDVKSEPRSNKMRNVISFVVSIAVALLVAAISMYYYQETKVTKENKDFERCIANNDTTMMELFLNTYPDASKAHIDTIHKRIDQIRNDEKTLKIAFEKRNKKDLLHYLSQHPSSKDRKKILLIVDTLDWDSTVKANNRQAYQDYLTAHADGVFAAEAKEKLSDKELETTQADRDKMGSLFHDFFISVNTKAEDGLKRNLSSKVEKFMGTENATNSQVVSWMERQYGEGVSKVIWRLNRDYKIRKREVSGQIKYNVDFTAQQDKILSNGKTQVNHYRITAGVTGDGKISSMDMSSYTPQAKSSNSSTSSSTAKSSSNSWRTIPTPS